MKKERARKENHASFLNRLKLKVTAEELALINITYTQSKYAHRSQKRDSGVRYFEHLRAVALILIDELEIYDYEMICAALLHDVLEDSHLFSAADIKFIFGENIAEMVTTLSMPPNDCNRFSSEKEWLDFYHQVIHDTDVQIQIIKLCDRLHNMRTLNPCTKEKRLRKTLETKTHYLPLIEKIYETYPRVADVLTVEFTKAIENLDL